MLKIMCPLCNKEAKISSTYLSVIVCQCTGKLEEVGNIVSGRFVPINSKDTKNSMRLEINNLNFLIKELVNRECILRAGLEMENVLSHDFILAKYFSLGKKYERIFILELESKPEQVDSKIMFGVRERKVTHFIGYCNNSVEESVEELIKLKLVEIDIIDQ